MSWGLLEAAKVGAKGGRGCGGAEQLLEFLLSLTLT